MSTDTTSTDRTRTSRAITVSDPRRRGVAKIVVFGWVIAALGIGFALGRLLPPSLLG